MLSGEGRGGIDARSLAWLFSMSLALIVILLPFSSYIAALSYIQEEWGLNNSQAGATFSAYLVGYAVSALIVMPLTDRLGAKRIFIGSALISTVAHCLFPLAASNMASAVVLRAVAGLGLVGLYMPGLRIVGERFGSRGRGTAMGVYVTAYYLAGSLSLSATGALMTWLDWRDAYLSHRLGGLRRSARGLPPVAGSRPLAWEQVLRRAGPSSVEKPASTLPDPGLLSARLRALLRAHLAPGIPHRRPRLEGRRQRAGGGRRQRPSEDWPWPWGRSDRPWAASCRTGGGVRCPRPASLR